MNTTRTRAKLALTFLLTVGVVCGCAHRYLMKLSNGDQIISISKPKLQGTQYHFHDDQGQECMIAKSRVVKIETGAVDQAEKKTAPAARPKKAGHWYFLWLA